MKRAIGLLLAVGLLCCLGYAAAFASDGNGLPAARASLEESATYTFTEEDYNENGTLKYFTPYFVERHNAAGRQVNVEDYWRSNFTVDTLSTEYEFSKDEEGFPIKMSEGNGVYLTLNTRQYYAFEAELTFHYLDGDHRGWIGLVFGQMVPGCGYNMTGGGAFAFAQAQGTCTAAGKTVSALSEGKKPADDAQIRYRSNNITLKLRVEGDGDLTMETWNADGSERYARLVLSDSELNTRGSQSLTDSEGYLSILSAGGYHAIQSLKVTPLAVETAAPDAQLVVSFREEGALEKFTPVYTQSNASGSAGTLLDAEEQWALTEDGTLLRIDGLGVSVDGNISALVLNEKFRYFEATLVYRNRTGNDGWIGFEFGLDTPADRFIDAAHGMFVQMAGIPTLAGLHMTTPGPYEEGAAPPNFSTIGWHTLKLRVTENCIELYIDDLQSPARTTKLDEVREGYLGIFSTGLSQAEFRSLSVNRLNADGTIAGE